MCTGDLYHLPAVQFHIILALKKRFCHLLEIYIFSKDLDEEHDCQIQF
jgi:hypothetical protein